jgi:hypothetical protein
MPAESGHHADTRQHAAACALQCEAAGTGSRDCSSCFEVLQVRSFRAMCEMQFQRSLTRAYSRGVFDSGVACCGMAGDRGMRFPEVIDGSTAPARMKLESEKSSNGVGVGVCASSSRTCEAAMSQVPYHQNQRVFQPYFYGANRAPAEGSSLSCMSLILAARQRLQVLEGAASARVFSPRVWGSFPVCIRGNRCSNL